MKLNKKKYLPRSDTLIQRSVCVSQFCLPSPFCSLLQNSTEGTCTTEFVTKNENFMRKYLEMNIYAIFQTRNY